jgi:hypothetical protein
MKGASLPHADKGYDSDAIRRQIEAKGAMPNNPAESQPALEELLRAVALPKPKRHRTDVLPAQGLSPHRDALRSPRQQLSRRRLPPRCRQLLVASLEPN